MKDHEVCDTELLAETPHCAVSICRNCRVYHVHIGPTSIRLRPEAFDELRAMLADLHYAIEARKLTPLSTLHSH